MSFSEDQNMQSVLHGTKRNHPVAHGTARKRDQVHAYLVGGGIASLASAVYLIREGKVPGKNIHIFEESDVNGGSLDGNGSAETGYALRGCRIFDEYYGCTFDLLSGIPSLGDPKTTVTNEIINFNKKYRIYSRARLVAGGKKADMSSFGFSEKDRLSFIRMLGASEESLGTSRIADHFPPDFFKTNFWYFYCTTFAFQPWHSAVEFRRYLLRFIHHFLGDGLKHMSRVWHTPYNQYDSIVLPVTTWLTSQGVNFYEGCEVTDLDIKTKGKKKTVGRIHYRSKDAAHELSLGKNDLVFVTNGSMTANSRLGSMTEAPMLVLDKTDGAWAHWEKLAKDRPDFGRPGIFDEHVDESKWESFTLTLRDPTFFTLMEQFTGNVAGTGGFVTLTDSNWLMSVVLMHQPHFTNQPENVQVCWGYGLSVDKPGNFVKKPMSACTGEEILTELLSHLRFTDDMQKIIKTSTCIPCMMPFITSQFLVRTGTDRPRVVPEGCTNLAFIGQFCEIPDEVVFTVEYSVRSAQTAVYTLLGLDKEVTPIYKGQHDIGVLFEVFRALHARVFSRNLAIGSDKLSVNRDSYEIIVVDGGYGDRTREIAG